MKDKLVIVGSGSQARYVIEIVNRSHCYMSMALVDVEKKENIGKTVNGVAICCMLSDVSREFYPDECKLIVAYGKNREKKEIVDEFTRLGYEFATIISPEAYIAGTSRIGEGSIINPLAAVMPNAVIGKHVIIHSNCVIEHDNEIGDFANISPGVTLAGNVEVGIGAYLYTGSKVIPKIKIGDWGIVGAGAVVIKDVEEGATVVGVPASPADQSRKAKGRKEAGFFNYR